MKNVYKLGGPWKTKCGTEYTVKSVSYERPYLDDGWSLSIDAMAIEGEFEVISEAVVKPKKRNKIAKALKDGVDN